MTRYKSKRAPLKEIKIIFSHLGAFAFHFSSASTYSKEEISTLFNRKWKTGNKVEVVVNEEKPVTIVIK